LFGGACMGVGRLENDKNFNEDEYRKILEDNNGRENFAIAEYRQQLLKQRDDEEDFAETKDNIQRLFLEDFDERQYNKIVKKLKENGWTLEQAYNKVKNSGCRLMSVSVIKNI
jgi:hypothetical protein